jgi:predicted Zn-dependent peptidase
MIKKAMIGEEIPFLSEIIPHIHSVSLGIWVKSGSLYDEESTKGIAHFVEHMLFKGTTKRNAFEIVKVIDDVGGMLNASTSKEYTSFYARVLKEDLPLAVDVICDIFLNSTFPEEELDRERGVVIQEIKMIQDTPDEYVHELLFGKMWGTHPLAHSIAGEVETINSLDRETLLSYRALHHTRGNILVGAVGNFEYEEIQRLFSRSLVGVPDGSMTEILPPRFIPGRIVCERDTEQVHVAMTFSSYPYSHLRRYAQYVLNTVVGGGMSSRLFQEVREKRGLVYNIYSFLSLFAHAGTLGFYAGTHRDLLPQVLEVIVSELEKLKQSPLSSEELASAKGQIKGNLLLSLESSANRLSRMIKNEMYFGRQITADEIIEGIDAVTIEDILEVANEIIDFDASCSAFLGQISEGDIPPLT